MGSGWIGLQSILDSSERRYSVMTAITKHTVKWIVLNQAQSPFHQKVIEHVASKVGNCLLYTGTPFESDSEHLLVLSGPRYNRQSLLHRAASWLHFTLKAGWLLMSFRRSVPVLVVTNPPTLPPIAWFLSLIIRRKYAVLAWDLYPDHLVAIGWFTDRNPLVWAWRHLNRAVFRRATTVMTIGDMMAKAIQETAGRDVRVAVIPNGADIDFLSPIPKVGNNFARAHDQVGRITVMYSGNIGATHGAEVIADVAHEFESRRWVRFLVVGDGLGRVRLEEACKERGLSNVLFLRYLPWEAVPESLACADIALVMQDGASAHLSLPSKLYSFLAVGAAILAVTPKGSDLERLLAERELGRAVEGGDTAKLCRVLGEMVTDQESLTRYRKNARNVAVSSFSCSVVAECWRGEVATLLERSGDL